MIGMLIATCLFTTALLLNVNTKGMSRPPNDTLLVISGFIGGAGMLATCVYGSFVINNYYLLMAIPSIFIVPHILINVFGKGPIGIWSILFNIVAVILSLSNL